jgi:hypothetical protein
MELELRNITHASQIFWRCTLWATVERSDGHVCLPTKRLIVAMLATAALCSAMTLPTTHRVIELSQSGLEAAHRVGHAYADDLLAPPEVGACERLSGASNCVDTWTVDAVHLCPMRPGLPSAEPRRRTDLLVLAHLLLAAGPDRRGRRSRTGTAAIN